MFEKIKNYKIIFIKDNGLKVQEFRSKDFIFPGIILFVLISFVISLTFFSKDIKDIITLRTISKHNQNNRELNALIINQQQKIDTLLREIQNIYKNDENLRKLIKLPSIDEDIRKLGVGGNEGKEKYNELDYLLPDSFDLDKMNSNINFLMRSINLEKLSYIDIEEEIVANQDYLLSYPAVYPINKEHRKFSSRYGYRIDPFSKKRRFHDGDDFSTEVGVEVMATANGKVKSSKYNGSFGNFIEIEHGNGYVTVYGHLSKRFVKKGELIERGDVIGKVGNTGRSTAPHLHYEIQLHDKHVNPRDYYYN